MAAAVGLWDSMTVMMQFLLLLGRCLCDLLVKVPAYIIDNAKIGCQYMGFYTRCNNQTSVGHYFIIDEGFTV